MRKKYFINYYKNFANTYNLCWVEGHDKKTIDLLLENGWENITRKNAFEKCVQENDRRKNDASFSYFADNKILPYEYIGTNWQNMKYDVEYNYIIII